MPGIPRAEILCQFDMETSLATYTNRRTPVSVFNSSASGLPRMGARSAAAPSTPTVTETPLTFFRYVGTAVWSAVTLHRAVLVARTSPLEAVMSPRSAGTATMLKRLLSAAEAIAEESRACNRNSCAPKRLRTKSPTRRRTRTRRSGWTTPIRAGRDPELPWRPGETPPALLDAGDLRGVGLPGAEAGDVPAGRAAVPS